MKKILFGLICFITLICGVNAEIVMTGEFPATMTDKAVFRYGISGLGPNEELRRINFKFVWDSSVLEFNIYNNETHNGSTIDINHRTGDMRLYGHIPKGQNGLLGGQIFKNISSVEGTTTVSITNIVIEYWDENGESQEVTSPDIVRQINYSPVNQNNTNNNQNNNNNANNNQNNNSNNNQQNQNNNAVNNNPAPATDNGNNNNNNQNNNNINNANNTTKDDEIKDNEKDKEDNTTKYEEENKTIKDELDKSKDKTSDKTTGDSKDSKKSSSNFTLYVVIGVLSGLLIIAIIVLVIFLILNKKKKDKSEK